MRLNLKVILSPQLSQCIYPWLDVNGNWGEWGAYSACNAACGDGKKQRQRNCDNPRQEGSGQDCVGDAVELADCNEGACTQGELALPKTIPKAEF